MRSSRSVSVAIQIHREGDHGRIVPTGPFDLSHATEAAQAVRNAERLLLGCCIVDLDLAEVDRIDGAGAVLLARLLDRLEGKGLDARVTGDAGREATHLIARYRQHRQDMPHSDRRHMPILTGTGVIAVHLLDKLNEAFDFTGRCAVALPKTGAIPLSVGWRSIPQLIQDIGADGLPVVSAANLLVGVILGFLGASQLGRFGALSFVPQLVVVAHFRELGPLITALVVAGRSGAGLASEIATMKVSEEIDALRAMGIDPLRWLVVPRCLALIITLPLLTWIGDLLALAGGLAATTVITNMTPHAYIEATAQNITIADVLAGLVKSPFLALAIGLIACGQGLATKGGAAAVGSRTTTAVVQSMFFVMVISAIFTFYLALIGV